MHDRFTWAVLQYGVKKGLEIHTTKRKRKREIGYGGDSTKT